VTPDPVLLGAVWSGGLLLAWLLLPRWAPRLTLSGRNAALLIAGVALVARLVPALILGQGGGFDIDSFRVVSGLVLRGEDVYLAPAALDRYPYLPLQMYWMAGAAWLASVVPLPFGFLVKLAPISADVGIALAISRLLSAGPDSAGRGLKGGLSYALHPVAVFVSAYHGQFDAIPLFLTLLAVLAAAGSAGWAGGWLGLAILDKSWPVLFVPSFLSQLRGSRRRWQFLAALALVPAIGVAVYLAMHGTPIVTLIGRAVSYNHGVGVWGYAYLPRQLWLLVPSLFAPYGWLIAYGRYLTLAALAAVWLGWARRQSLPAGMLTLMVAFLALTHAFSIQYLVWVVPFAVLDDEPRPWLLRYTLAAFAYMLLVYSTLILAPHIQDVFPSPLADAVIIWSGLPAWLVCLGWLIARLRLASPAAPPAVDAGA
jgi:hypothetical protein